MTLDWTALTGLLSVLFVVWLLVRVFLRGPSLRAYDQPPTCRVGVRERASPEHQHALRLIEQAIAEISAVPRKQRLDTIRQVMARGFVEPLLLTGNTGYHVREMNADGVPSEWVLAPHSDPNRRLLYLHGGSFLSGCPHGHRVITTELARVTGAAVLALDYRLMPEYPRQALNADCQTGYRWILDHGPAGPAPVQELFIAGDSAGGNLTLMLIAWARDTGLRPANGAIALSPSVDMTLSSPTLRSNLKTDLMLGPGLKWMLHLPQTMLLLTVWLWGRMIPPNPFISPIFSDLTGLPPVLVQASEAEMMLGDARRYVNKARAAGSPAELETWPELPHVWHLFGTTLPEAQEAFERIGQFVERCTDD